MARPEIATLLALSSALCIAIGDVLQQQAAQRITDASVGHVGLFANLLRNQRWWCGTFLLAASIALQAAALGQGSVLLVQALLMLSVLFALPINARFARRTVTGAEWIWAGLLTAAVTVVVVVGHPQAGRSSAPIGNLGCGGRGARAAAGRMRCRRPNSGRRLGGQPVRSGVGIAVGGLCGADQRRSSPGWAMACGR